MTNDNYLIHVKVLGKLCWLWDNASADLTALKTFLAVYADQVATGLVGSYDAVLLMLTAIRQLDTAIQAGPGNMRTFAVQQADAYLASTVFRDTLVTNPAASVTAKAALEALILEMTTDAKTFTTVGSTGLVNFFETNWSPSGSFPQSGSPSYPDATYVVPTIV